MLFFAETSFASPLFLHLSCFSRNGASKRKCAIRRASLTNGRALQIQPALLIRYCVVRILILRAAVIWNHVS
jgi:hypothetical protein